MKQQTVLSTIGVLMIVLSCNHTKEVSKQISEKQVEDDRRWRQDLGPTSENKEGTFRVQDSDTMNRIDQNGLLQGEWERLHPDGSFKCRGVYKDGYKMGYWERKYSNGNWRY